MADFLERSRDVVREFLQTAVVVDDEALYSPPPPEAVAALVPPDPGPLGSVAPLTVSGPAAAEGAVASEPDPIVEHPLNAADLVQAFAGIGVVAAVMRPEPGNKTEQGEFDSAFLHAARRADIVVMDWSIFRDGGQRARRLIASLLKKDVADRRLRLIAVYTGELDLNAIVRSIEESLGGLVESTPDDFVLAKDGLQVCVLAKEESEKYTGGARERVTPLERLPERLVGEFAGLTAGLLANVALASIASVRRNTHHLVAKFGPVIDAAYLADAAARADYLDAVALATSLAGREMRNVVNQNEVDELLNLEVVASWLAWRRSAGVEFVARIEGQAPVPLEDKVLLDLVERGKGAALPVSGMRPSQLSYLDIFEGMGTRTSSEHEYSMLAFLDGSRTDAVGYAKKHLPELTLGTVVEGTTAKHRGRLFVCTQAVCDSVRLDAARIFPFLPLEVTAGDFDLAVCSLAGERLRLEVSLKQFDVQQFAFDPDPTTRTVRATAKRLFKGHGRNSFGWIAQLRPEQAQRLINSFARGASRVGLDEVASGSAGRRSRLDG